MTRPRRQTLAFGALLTLSAAWGSTFFLIKDLATRLGVLYLLAVRFAVAALALAALAAPRLRVDATVLRRGVPLGLLYGSAQILQTAGLSLTSASVAGFVTGLYVVLTPLLGALLLGSRVDRATGAGAVLAAVGLGVLSLDGLSLGGGGGGGGGGCEALTLASAAVYALHILALSRPGRADVLRDGPAARGPLTPGPSAPPGLRRCASARRAGRPAGSASSRPAGRRPGRGRGR